jgi:4-amino-4-deoxy-L-arabinose transferase-like glycosyltransferase
VLPALLLAPWWQSGAPAGGWLRWYLGGLAAVLLGAGLALLWAVPAGAAGGEAYREAIFWGQTAGRMLASFAHRSPWWSYLLWLPLMWLPWLLWPAVWRGFRRLPIGDPGVRFCLAVLVPALLVFSLISGKQGKYLLPLLPLAALLTARALVALEPAAVRYRLWPATVMLAVVGVALTALPWWPQGPAWSVGVLPLWGPGLLLGALLFAGLRLPRQAAVQGLALSAALGTATLYAGVVSPLAPRYRLQELAVQLADLQRDGYALAWLGKYHGQFQFLGRLRLPVKDLQESGRLRGWLQAHPRGYVLVNYRDTRPDVPDGLTLQPYRGGTLVLWPARQLLRSPQRLDALAGNA